MKTHLQSPEPGMQQLDASAVRRPMVLRYQSHRPHSNATDDVELLSALKHSVDCLSKCSLDSDVKAAVQELLCFCHNLSRIARNPFSVEDQLDTLWPIRNWLRTVPRATSLIKAQDTHVLLYLANYEIIVIATCARLPQLSIGLSLNERASRLFRMRELVGGLALSRNEKFEAGDDLERNTQREERARQAWLDGWDLFSQFFALSEDGQI